MTQHHSPGLSFAIALMFATTAFVGTFFIGSIVAESASTCSPQPCQVITGAPAAALYGVPAVVFVITLAVLALGGRSGGSTSGRRIGS